MQTLDAKSIKSQGEIEHRISGLQSRRASLTEQAEEARAQAELAQQRVDELLAQESEAQAQQLELEGELQVAIEAQSREDKRRIKDVKRKLEKLRVKALALNQNLESYTELLSEIQTELPAIQREAQTVGIEEVSARAGMLKDFRPELRKLPRVNLENGICLQTGN